MLDNLCSLIFVCVSIYIIKKITDSKPNKIKFGFKFFIFCFLSSLLACVIWPYFLLSPKNVRNCRAAASILKHITKLFDVKWHLRNGEVLSEDRGAVIVSNHQSSLDILGLFNIWQIVDKLTAIAKKEVFYVWPFGLAAYLAGVVFIDRNKTKEAYNQLKITSEVMVKNKTKLWLFPEGTRNKDHTTLLPFKRGAFVMAVNCQVPIIPVVFSPYYFMNKKKYIFDKGHVIIQCLDPIPTKGLTLDDVPSLVKEVHDKMEETYRNLGKEVTAI